jgi:hypothetical protein
MYIEIKKGGANMANMFFEKRGISGELKECKINECPDYLYIDDVNAFYDACGEDYIAENVFSPGVYKWDDNRDAWKQTDETAITRPIMDIVRKKEKEVGGITKTASDKWNIEILLDDDTILKTNDELVTMDEVIEAIKTMLKPSFFGKRLKEITLSRGD